MHVPVMIMVQLLNHFASGASASVSASVCVCLPQWLQIFAVCCICDALLTLVNTHVEAEEMRKEGQKGEEAEEKRLSTISSNKLIFLLFTKYFTMYFMHL